MKKVLFAVLLILMAGLFVGAVHALDLQVVGVYTDPAHPPTLNQNATIRTDVVLRNSTGALSTTLVLNFGNGQSSTRTITLTPDTVLSYFDNVAYTTAGTYNIVATLDPSNVIVEDTKANNAFTKSVVIGGTSGTALSMSPIVLTANPGTSPTTSANLANTGSTDVSGLTLTSTALTSGANTIPASAVTIYPSNIAYLYVSSSTAISYTVAVPAGQIPGTYTGNLVVSYGGNQVNVPVTLTVNSVANAPAFTVNDLEFIPQDRQRGQNVGQTLHISNTGNQPLTISLTSTLPSQYKTSFSQSLVTVNPGASTDVSVTIFIPLSQSSGRSQISGGITATATNIQGLTQNANAFVTVASMLELYKVSLAVNSDTHSIANGDTYSKSDLKAGTPITLTIYVRNDFDSSNPVEIDSVTGDVRSSGSLDLDESDDFNDLQYGEKDQITVSTSIPTDAEDGDSYSIDIKASGRDQNGALHTSTYNVRLQVKRETHEITITSASIYPQHISCNGRVTITSTIKNTGRNSEDQVHLLIENNDLDISQRFYNMQLDTDSQLTKTYSFDVSNKTQPGQYDFMLTTFYNTNTESDTNAVSLIVDPCQQTTTTPTPSAGPSNNNNLPSIPPQIVPTGGATPVYGSSSFTDSTAYIVILVAAVVIVLAVLITLLVKFVF